MNHIDELDKRIIKATQAGLPLVQRPYAMLAKKLHCSEKEIQERLKRMLEKGIIRRIGAVPNHYKLGFRGNGMSVWDIGDENIDDIGRQIGALSFVSHAYQRPRHPDWRYNLFAMVHGKDRQIVYQKVQIIVDLLGADNDGHEVLFSTKILKKTGLRLL